MFIKIDLKFANFTRKAIFYRTFLGHSWHMGYIRLGGRGPYRMAWNLHAPKNLCILIEIDLNVANFTLKADTIVVE